MVDVKVCQTAGDRLLFQFLQIDIGIVAALIGISGSIRFIPYDPAVADLDDPVSEEMCDPLLMSDQQNQTFPGNIFQDTHGAYRIFLV